MLLVRGAPLKVYAPTGVIGTTSIQSLSNRDKRKKEAIHSSWAKLNSKDYISSKLYAKHFDQTSIVPLHFAGSYGYTCVAQRRLLHSILQKKQGFMAIRQEFSDLKSERGGDGSQTIGVREGEREARVVSLAAMRV
nr:hypothetical protein Iba_chr01aCG9720 [Ipomoea batatas]